MSEAKGSHVSVLQLLGVVFVVLKLVGVISWSWWLVLLPLYGELALILTIATLMLAARGIIRTRK